jgi:RIO kinase 2
MGIIEGGELAKWRKLANPLRVLREIMRNVRKAYLKVGVVHADLSEYNIILKPDMHVLIIDWPQYVRADHPNAQDFLLRDVRNVLDFFVRRYQIRIELDAVLDYVTGKSRGLAI